MARTIDVVSLYPKDMNIYGDSGNVLTIPPPSGTVRL